MAFSTRRGRQRSKQPKFDYGTPELRQKKMAILQKNSPYAQNSDSLLGILWERKYINETMFEAGRYIQELHYRYSTYFCSGGWCGYSHEAYWQENGLPQYLLGTQEETPGQLYTYKAWSETESFLKDLGTNHYKAVMKITLQSAPQEQPHPRELALCRYGLFFLGNWLKTGKRARVTK